jgi:phosphohistidine phosphatase SixA
MKLDRRHLLVGSAALLSRSALAQATPAAPAPVLLMRHGLTEPGVGDPPGFVLGRCETQRNLSAPGRAQALTLGQSLAARGWRPRLIRSSRWCRCLDTARQVAAGLGANVQVQSWPALDSLFGAQERERAQTAALRERLSALRGGSALVELWVTHQVNIGALAGRSTAMGQALWLDERADGVLQLRAFEA